MSLDVQHSYIPMHAKEWTEIAFSHVFISKFCSLESGKMTSLTHQINQQIKSILVLIPALTACSIRKYIKSHKHNQCLFVGT